VFLPSMIVITAALALLAVISGPLGMTVSAVLFGVGYGTAWPVYVAYVMGRVSDARRGAAYGAMIAALDTGIGTGSTGLGWMIDRHGFAAAFALAAALSACSVPYFLATDRLIAEK
jgi:predicted MFS family arabinose efflux permease